MPLIPIIVLRIKTGLDYKLSTIAQVLTVSSSTYLGAKSKLEVGDTRKCGGLPSPSSV